MMVIKVTRINGNAQNKVNVNDSKPFLPTVTKCLGMSITKHKTVHK